MKSKTYEEFVEKFKPKKTTDDCYTPTIVYNAVAEWVSNTYNLDKSTFLRPFYPGGDYLNFNYSHGTVVDNPPFSILIQIVRFYTENNIKFFLFAPTLVSCRYGDFCTVLPINVDIRYENGAAVSTSFITNLEPYETRVKSYPSLYQAVQLANAENIQKSKKELPKYIYPKELITISQIYNFSKYGIDFEIPRAESSRIASLESQRKKGKTIYGNGWLVSERIQAERAQAERAQAERAQAERAQTEEWELSAKEKAIVKSLSAKSK